MAPIFLIPAILIALCIWYLFHYNTIVLSNWSHGFDDTQFSSEDFYRSVQQSLEKRAIPGISFTRVSHILKIRTVVLDERREYLCVTREDYQFQICAAPFGTGFFVSWWFLEREPGYMTLLKKIPVLRLIAQLKTFHQLDTEAMYRSFVHMCVLEAIDTMTTAKGMRSISEYDRRIVKSAD